MHRPDITRWRHFKVIAQQNNWEISRWPVKKHLYYKIQGKPERTNSGYVIPNVYDELVDMILSPEWVQQGKKLPNGKKPWVRVQRFWKHGMPAIHKFSQGQIFYNHTNGWSEATRAIQISAATPDKFNSERGEIENGFVEFTEYEMKPGNLSGKEKIISSKQDTNITQTEFANYLGLSISPKTGD